MKENVIYFFIFFSFPLYLYFTKNEGISNFYLKIANTFRIILIFSLKKYNNLTYYYGTIKIKIKRIRFDL